jgi:hypothetical protein
MKGLRIRSDFTTVYLGYFEESPDYNDFKIPLEGIIIHYPGSITYAPPDIFVYKNNKMCSSLTLYDTGRIQYIKY